jgi:hypothetical protein
MLLTVRQLPTEDIYKDLFRIPEHFRTDRDGRPILESTICEVSTGDRSILLWARGSTGDTTGVLRIDDKTRNALGVAWNSEHDFKLQPVRWLGQVKWACRASDQATRTAAWLGVLSVVLGFLGLILGIWCLCLTFSK